jgi:hypothetical protein
MHPLEFLQILKAFGEKYNMPARKYRIERLASIA